MDQVVELRGAPLELLNSIVGPQAKRDIVREILLEGPRGTGKSRGALQVIAALMENYPKLNVLLCRKTRDSMTGSTLPEWEKCWPEDHPILQGPRPEGRAVYRHPKTKACAFVAGLNETERHRSTNWDVAYFEECTEGTLDDWEQFHGSMRNWKMHQQLLIGTCNPKQPQHYINQRCISGLTERMVSRFEDNPLWHTGREWTKAGAAFIDSLRKMSGVRYKRDYLGLWIASEGLVFDNYEPETHLVTAEIDRSWDCHVMHVDGWIEPVYLDWYFVALDFGNRSPGCAQVWGVDRNDRMFLVAEVYQPGKSIDWWAYVLEELHQDFPFDRGVADSADATGAIKFLNDRLGPYRGRSLTRVIHPADKARGKLYGIDQLRWGFDKVDGGPRTYLLRNSLRYGKCADLASKGRPTCLEEELLEYEWEELKPGDYRGEKRERPSANAADHSIDAAIYAHVFAWRKDLRPPRQKRGYKPGTWGSILRYKGEELPWPSLN